MVPACSILTSAVGLVGTHGSVFRRTLTRDVLSRKRMGPWIEYHLDAGLVGDLERTHERYACLGSTESVSKLRASESGACTQFLA
jgi:hypothetical protein